MALGSDNVIGDPNEVETPMSPDQLTFDNPVERHSHIVPQAQWQPFPGLDSQLSPRADHGETTYRGTGRLQGRKALITGADSGVGAAVAIAFAREGADVAMNYLPAEQEDADAIAAIVRAEGRTAVLLPGDITDREFCRSLVAGAVEGLGGLDILVNNAAYQVYHESFDELDEENLELTIKTNLSAMFWITRDALPHLGPAEAVRLRDALRGPDLHRRERRRADRAVARALQRQGPAVRPGRRA